MHVSLPGLFASIFSLLALASCDAANDTTGTGDGSSQTGIPCDVEAVLETCTTCHAGATPSDGLSLVTRDDLLAKSTVDSSMTVAQRALARMKDPDFPMPPNGGLDAAQIDTFATWVNDGVAGGDCDSVAGGPPDTTCTSTTTWTQGNHGSPNMHPGVACIACHEGPTGGHSPSLLFAGTVYPTLHEPDDCLGGGSSIDGAIVVVTDANGTDHKATVRSNGNFVVESNTPLALPARAEVQRNGKVAKMKDDVTNGDCNSCHTEQGKNDAPGRIQAP